MERKNNLGSVPSTASKFEEPAGKVEALQGQFEEPSLEIGPEETDKSKKHPPEEYPVGLEPSSKRKLAKELSEEEEESEHELEESFDEEDENYEEQEEQLSHHSDAEEELDLEAEELSEKEEQEPEEGGLKSAQVPIQSEPKKTIILARPVSEPSTKEPSVPTRVIRTSIQRIPTLTVSSSTSTSPVSNVMPVRLNKPLKGSGTQRVPSAQAASTTSGTKGARSGRGLKRGSKRPHHQS